MSPNPEAMQFVFTSLMTSIRNGCLLLIPLLFLIKTAWALIKGFTSDVHIHYQGILGAVLLWLLVACYPELIGQLDTLTQAIIGFVTPPVDDPVTAVMNAMTLRENSEKAYLLKDLGTAVGQMGQGQVVHGSGKAISDISGYFIKSVKDSGDNLIGGMLSIFASLARMVIETVRSMLLKFLIAVGPLALTFSIADGFGHVSRHWFQKLLSVYCWSLTLNILDHVVIEYFSRIALGPLVSRFTSTQAPPESPYFMDQLIVGGMYMMVPWLTGSYLGGVNAGQFLTNKVRILSTLASTVSGTAKSLLGSKR